MRIGLFCQAVIRQQDLSGGTGQADLLFVFEVTDDQKLLVAAFTQIGAVAVIGRQGSERTNGQRGMRGSESQQITVEPPN